MTRTGTPAVGPAAGAAAPDPGALAEAVTGTKEGGTDGLPTPPAGIAGQHLIRYGTAADQQYLLNEFVGTYDQLVVNGRMVAHMPAGLASFLLHQARNKPYFIDPETHAFQHAMEHLESTGNGKEGELKRPVQALAERYGDPVVRRVIAAREPVLPADFEDQAARAAFCERVLDFQASSIAGEAEESPAAKYYQFLAAAGGVPPVAFGPTLLVAPYFYMTASTVGAWLPINIECVRDARPLAARRGRPLAAQVAVSKDLVRSAPLRRDLVGGYAEYSRPDLFLLWVDGFSEQEQGAEALGDYAAFVQELSEVAPVVSLYGGYFSVALMRTGLARGLAGVTHSLEYGEHRSVIPVGGGVPVSKFYVPALHSRLVFREAYRAAVALGGMASTGAFHASVCDCPECRLVITGDPADDFYVYGATTTLPPKGRRKRPLEFPTPETKAHCVRHYMWAKEREYRDESDVQAIVARLRSRIAPMRGALAPELYLQCREWSRALARLAGLPEDDETEGAGAT